MYNLTREEASLILEISVRSVDRYIKSWKLRSKKDWKKVLINTEDVEILKSWWNKNKQEIITPESNNKSSKISPDINSKEIKNIEKVDNSNTNNALDNIYNDLKNEIDEKNNIITELSFKLWKLEEIAKNSITLAEHNKNQFLLEESKQEIEEQLSNKNKENIVLKKKFKDEKYANLILIIISLVLFVILAFVWYSKI